MFFFFGPFYFFFIIFFFLFAFRVIPRLFRSLFSELGHFKPRNFPGSQSQTANTASFKVKSGSPESGERQIFNAAKKLKGRLTLSDIVMETNLSLADAEKTIDRMVDEIHVRMVVKNNGLIIYEFPEIMARYQEGNDFFRDI